MGAITALKPRTDTVWMSPAQVCEHIPGMTEKVLANLRGKGQGPRYAKPSPKTVVYALADVDVWVTASMVGTKAVS